jgi:hypothetical protein
MQVEQQAWHVEVPLPPLLLDVSGQMAMGARTPKGERNHTPFLSDQSSTEVQVLLCVPFTSSCCHLQADSSYTPLCGFALQLGKHTNGLQNPTPLTSHPSGSAPTAIARQANSIISKRKAVACPAGVTRCFLFVVEPKCASAEGHSAAA